MTPVKVTAEAAKVLVPPGDFIRVNGEVRSVACYTSVPSVAAYGNECGDHVDVWHERLEEPGRRASSRVTLRELEAMQVIPRRAGRPLRRICRSSTRVLRSEIR